MGSVDSVSLGKGSLLMTGTHSNAIFQSPVISISSQILRSKERKLFLLHCHFDKEAILGGNEGLAMIEGRKRNSQYWLSLQSIKVLDVRSACARSDISSCNRRWKMFSLSDYLMIECVTQWSSKMKISLHLSEMVTMKAVGMKWLERTRDGLD